VFFSRTLLIGLNCADVSLSNTHPSVQCHVYVCSSSDLLTGEVGQRVTDVSRSSDRVVNEKGAFSRQTTRPENGSEESVQYRYEANYIKSQRTKLTALFCIIANKRGQTGTDASKRDLVGATNTLYVQRLVSRLTTSWVVDHVKSLYRLQ